MNIRTATVSDASVLSRIAIDSVAPHKNTDFSDQGWERFLSANSVESTLNRLASKQYKSFCCTQDGETVGFITIHKLEKIDQLFVLPDAQRKGVARTLWEHARQESLAVKHPLRFWVRSSTMAVPVYRRFGFVEDGCLQMENGIAYQLLKFEDPPIE